MNRFYVSDVDGTLLNSGGSLSAFSREHLTRLLNDDLPFTLASARSYVTIREKLHGIPFRHPIVEVNGAFITDWETGEHVATHAIAPELLEVYFTMFEGGFHPVVVTYNGREDCLYFGELVNGGLKFYHNERYANKDRRLRRLDDVRRIFTEQVVSFVVIEKYDRLAELERSVLDTYKDRLFTHLMFNLYCPDWHWLTIHDPRANKGFAARALTELIGRGDSELVVFGDHSNDESLFAAADIKIAVGNAEPELKEMADLVIGTNDDDGVVKYLMNGSLSTSVPEK